MVTSQRGSVDKVEEKEEREADMLTNILFFEINPLTTGRDLQVALTAGSQGYSGPRSFDLNFLLQGPPFCMRQLCIQSPGCRIVKNNDSFT